MTPAAGFPPGVRFTPVPDPFIESALLEIEDLAEIKASLYVIWRLHQKKGYPALVALDELLADSRLIQGLSQEGQPGEEALRMALGRAAARGTLLRLAVIKDGERRDIFMLNTEPNRRVAGQIERGLLDLGRPLPFRRTEGPPETPDIFRLYQENIGLLTPLIADELREAEQTYPPSWIEEAFTEAVAQNKRSWRYISRILERWSLEGKTHGKPGRYPQQAGRS